MKHKKSDAAAPQSALWERVRGDELERRRLAGETWGYEGGWWYKIFKILFFVSNFYVLLLNGVHMLALGLSIEHTNELMHSTAEQSAAVYTANVGFYRANLWIMAIVTVMLLAAVILMICKRHLGALIASGVTASVSMAVYLQLLGSDKLYLQNQKGLFVALYICTLLIPLNALAVHLIVRHDRRELQRLYTRALELLYASKAQKGKMLSQQEWEEAVEHYETVKKAPPPARRHRLPYDPGSPDEVGTGNQ